MYQVLDSYQRFDQKNNMVNRPLWDSSLHYLLALDRETRLRQMRSGVAGLELKDFALVSGASVGTAALGTDTNTPNSGLTSWEPLPLASSNELPEWKSTVTDVAQMTDQIKRVARYLGADLVGIARLDMRWVYSHHYIRDTGESQPVEIGERYKYVIAIASEMDNNMIKTAPTALSWAEDRRIYSRMALLVSSLAQFIRQLGYGAIPSLNDTALNVPIAVDAGLGGLARHGLLITPQFGPRQRLCKVITDLPLEPDEPIEFGVTEFCSVCHKCAWECPGQAISYGESTAKVSSISNNPGVVKWPLSAEKCREYWSKIGTDCSICIRVCPFNKDKGWLHDTARWLIEHAPWVDRTMVWLDNRMGYGKYSSPNVFWNA